MRTTTVLLLATFLASAAIGRAFSQNQSASYLVIPAASQISMQLTRPIWAGRAKPGDLFYAETTEPFTLGNQTVIPYGSYVEGAITSFTQPTPNSSEASFHLQFNKLIFPNGYTIVLTKPNVRAIVTVKVSTRNDLLLDNGAALAMTLRSPLKLDAAKVAASLPLAQPPTPGSFVPATLCRFIPGTPGDNGDPGSPGTPDTTIPGSPGTPDIVIPGSGGAPDTVIPGMPASPPTVIPGTPATPSRAPTPPTDPIYCPDPPAVTSSVLEVVPHTTGTHKKSAPLSTK